MRLYPAYIVIAAFYALKIALGLTGEETFARFTWLDAIGNLVMLVGWGLNIYPLIGVAWASSAELGSYFAAPVLIKYTLQKNIAWLTACVGLSLLAIYLISISGEGVSGPLDIVSRDSLLPLLRAIAGFTLGLATFRCAAYLDRLSAITQDVLVVAILASMVAVAALTVDDLPIYLLFTPFIAILSRAPRAHFLFDLPHPPALHHVRRAFVEALRQHGDRLCALRADQLCGDMAVVLSELPICRASRTTVRDRVVRRRPDRRQTRQPRPLDRQSRAHAS
jgi:hypothetical protein